MRIRIPTAALVVLALSLLLVACGGGGGAKAPTATAAAEIDATVAFWEARAERDPSDYLSRNRLGNALLRRARLSGDVADYRRAEIAFGESLATLPENLDGLIGMAFVAVAQHRFGEAVLLAERATAADPGEPAAYAVQGDALLALGRYPDAREAYAKLHALAPSLASFARLAELAEITGDLESATIAWRNALSFSQSRPDDRVWALVGFADFRFAIGDLDGASQLYEEALDAQPDYLQAFAGSARVAAANGDGDAAIARYETVVRRLPTPEHVLALADLYQATGRAEAAGQQRALVFAIADLYAANGIALDLTMALFLADYGDPMEAVMLADSAYAARPSVHAADALAWALSQAGRHREAAAYSDEALRFGTPDARFLYHAGVIRLRLGQPNEARRLLTAALDLNPHFFVTEAEHARSPSSIASTTSWWLRDERRLG